MKKSFGLPVLIATIAVTAGLMSAPAMANGSGSYCSDSGPYSNFFGSSGPCSRPPSFEFGFGGSGGSFRFGGSFFDLNKFGFWGNNAFPDFSPFKPPVRVAEPATLGLLGLGLAAVGLARRRKTQR